MRKETLLVIGFLVIVLGTTALIWSFALPDLRPMHLPKAESATVLTGPSRKARPLGTQELTTLNQWLEGHRSGWGPMTKAAPSSGDAIITIVGADGHTYRLTLFTGLSGADWDDTVVAQIKKDAPFRMKRVTDDTFAPLRHLVDEGTYERSDAP